MKQNPGEAPTIFPKIKIKTPNSSHKNTDKLTAYSLEILEYSRRKLEHFRLDAERTDDDVFKVENPV